MGSIAVTNQLADFAAGTRHGAGAARFATVLRNACSQQHLTVTMDTCTVSDVLGTWGYPALLLILVLNGRSPIPEDLVLLAVGYLVYIGVFQWPLALAVGVVGVVVSDLLLFSAGRHLGWRSPRWSDGRPSPEGFERTTRWFARLGHRAILLARFIPGTRALVFITAGARDVPVWSFLRFDLLGAALWVPAMLAVGHAFGDTIGDAHEAISWLHHGAIWAAGLIALLLLALWLSSGRSVSKLR